MVSYFRPYSRMAFISALSDTKMVVFYMCLNFPSLQVALSKWRMGLWGTIVFQWFQPTDFQLPKLPSKASPSIFPGRILYFFPLYVFGSHPYDPFTDQESLDETFLHLILIFKTTTTTTLSSSYPCSVFSSRRPFRTTISQISIPNPSSLTLNN